MTTSAAAAFVTPRSSSLLFLRARTKLLPVDFIMNHHQQQQQQSRKVLTVVSGTSSSAADNTTEDDGDNEELNYMESLQQRIDRQRNQYSELFSSTDNDDDDVDDREVHIIVYKPGTEDQGLHMIQYPAGSGINICLAFEAELECEGFCRLLMKDQSSALPNKEGETKRFGALPIPMPIDLSNLKMAFAGQGLLIKVVPEGANLTHPPDSRCIYG